ncbi:hypothetical protein ACIA8K_13780 [Catenuloplanes sp. NPDC051500]|uniref:hypothetical protein n=1 Tax=Catenuloplanes sp. NPDC051500 TaxID=3363959 RepID=UPI00378D1DA9
MTQHDPPTDRSNGPSGPDDTSTAPADRGPDCTLLHEENDLPLAGMAHAETVNIELGYTRINSPELPDDSIDHGDATLVTEALPINSPSAGPVFVDATGRRRKRVRRLAYAVGALCMVYTGMVGVSLAGGPVSPHALLPFPEVLENALPGLLPPEPSPTEATPIRSADPQQNTAGPYQAFPQPDVLPQLPPVPTQTVGVGLGVKPTVTPTTSPRPLESAVVTPTPSKPADPTPVTPTPSATTPVLPTPSISIGGPVGSGSNGGNGGAGGGAGAVPVPESGGTPASGSGPNSGGTGGGGTGVGTGGTGGGTGAGNSGSGNAGAGQGGGGSGAGGAQAPVVEQPSTGGAGGGGAVTQSQPESAVTQPQPAVAQPQPESAIAQPPTYVAPAPAAPAPAPAAPEYLPAAPIDEARPPAPVEVITEEITEDVTADDDPAETDDESPEIDT